jgi:hypothetical protein
MSSHQTRARPSSRGDAPDPLAHATPEPPAQQPSVQRGPARGMLPAIADIPVVVLCVAAIEISVARLGDSRPDWSWIAIWLVPIAAALLSHRRSRGASAAAIGAGFVMGLALADVALSRLGWNGGKPAGWDLFDSDPAPHIVAEALAFAAWATLVAALAWKPEPRLGPEAHDARLGVFAFGSMLLLLAVPAVVFAVTRGALPPARIVQMPPPPTAVTAGDPLADGDDTPPFARVRYFDPGVPGNLTIRLEVAGTWYAAQARLGAADKDGSGPRDRWIDVPLPNGVQADDLSALSLRVWPRSAEPYVEDMLVVDSPGS